MYICGSSEFSESYQSCEPCESMCLEYAKIWTYLKGDQTNTLKMFLEPAPGVNAFFEFFKS